MSAREGSPSAQPAAGAPRGTGAHKRGCEVLAVFAHPDDESLLAGGTLAACAAAGLRVGIASMTRGELGVVARSRAAGDVEIVGASGRGSAPVSGSELGDARERELIEAAAVLGACWARCLDLPDGELESFDRVRAARAVRMLVDEHEPTVLLTFSRDGLYWHPDHTAAHEIVHEAAPHALICEVTWPRGLLAQTVRELRRRGLPADVWGLDPRAFGAPAEAIAHELDVAPFLDTKLRALRCHRSQLLAGHALADLPDDLARDLLGREWLGACGPAEWLAQRVAAGCAAGRHA